MSTIIIFGPTGNVGSHVALAAPSFGGSRIILAMRDPKKSIPSIPNSPTYERIHADLSDPSSLTTAVTTTGATRAFIYHTHSPDHMHSALTALKSSGIQFVVFLSTGGLRGDLTKVDPKESIIFWSHAQVELNIQSIFGKENYVPIRPGFFASNSFQYKEGIKKGKVEIFVPDIKMDWITPGDIGRVAASVLVKGAREGYNGEAIWLVGPQKVSVREGVKRIGRSVTEGEVDVEEVDAKEGVRLFVERGVPKQVAETLVSSFGKLNEVQERGEDWLPEGEEWERQVGEVDRYTGRKAQTLDEWIEENKGVFE